MSDWSLLIRSLGGYSFISDAKVAVYEMHQKDLKDLKYICKKYFSSKQNYEIFKNKKTKNNYADYVHNGDFEHKGSEKIRNQKDFCDFVLKYLKNIKPEDTDKSLTDELIEK